MVEDYVGISSLSVFDAVGGPVFRGMRVTDQGFAGFGELYFSEVCYGGVKAWKRHTDMTMNLMVPVGSVKFVFYDEAANKFVEHVIGRQRYCRMTVLPGVWFGFQGFSKGTNLIANFSNITHDPKEVQVRDIDSFNYQWPEV